MLRESSAARLAASLLWRSLAILSSCAVWAGVAPLDSVSLSCVGGAGFLSSTSGLHAAGGLAVGGCHRSSGHLGRQAATEVVEIAALGGDDLARLFSRNGVGLRLARHVEHRASLDAVDVAADERIGIAAQHGHQHLVQTTHWPAGCARRCGWPFHQRVRAAAGCLPPPRALGLGAGAGAAARSGAGRGGCTGRGGRGAGASALGAGAVDATGAGADRVGCLYRRRGSGLCGGRGADPGRQRCRSGLAQVRWIKQQGVVAHDATRRPVGLQDHVHEGFADRTRAGQAQVLATVGPALQAHLQFTQGGVDLHAGGAERIHGRHTHAKAGGFFCRDLRYVDFRPQRLTQGRLHHDAAQGQCREPRP